MARGFPVDEGLTALLLAAIVRGRAEHVRHAFEEALRNRVSPVWLGEALRMAHLFCGFPRAIQGLRAIQDLCDAHGVSLPADAVAEPDRETLEQRGRELFGAIYGEHAATVQASLQVLPGYDQWVLQHAYGRVLTRPGLDARPRELLAVAALCVSEGGDQLISHARGAQRLGARPDQVVSLARLVADCLGPDAVGDSVERLVAYFGPGSDASAGGSSATSGTPPSTV